VATIIFKFINANSKETLKNRGIKDITTMVMETEKIFTKRNLIQQAQNKCIMVRRSIEFFTNNFENLVKTRLPIVWDDKGNILTFECYKRDMFKFI
jgi:hypothetical protein